jgi:hypothetical protein
MKGLASVEVWTSRAILDSSSGGCSMMVLAVFERNSVNNKDLFNSWYWLKASLRKILV